MESFSKVFFRALGLIEKFIYTCLIFMALAILWNLAEYGIQQALEGKVSFKPKGWQYESTEVS